MSTPTCSTRRRASASPEPLVPSAQPKASLTGRPSIETPSTPSVIADPARLPPRSSSGSSAVASVSLYADPSSLWQSESTPILIAFVGVGPGWLEVVTQTPPAPVAICPGVDLTRIVATTVFVLGSIREIVSSNEFATQTAPSPAAMPSIPRPTRIVLVTRFVVGSMRETVSSSMAVTHTAPSPAAICPGHEWERDRRRHSPGARIDSPHRPAEGVPGDPDRSLADREAVERLISRQEAGAVGRNRHLSARGACREEVIDPADDSGRRIGEPDPARAACDLEGAVAGALQPGRIAQGPSRAVERRHLVRGAVGDHSRSSRGGDTGRLPLPRDRRHGPRPGIDPRDRSVGEVGHPHEAAGDGNSRSTCARRRRSRRPCSSSDRCGRVCRPRAAEPGRTRPG